MPREQSVRLQNPRTLAAFAVIVLALGAAWLFFSAQSPRAVVSPPLEGGGRGRGKTSVDQDAPALLAKYYPAKTSASTAPRYFRIQPVADGFAPPDMQPTLNTPGSRWRNPAKTVQPIFPKNFANPVRVRCSTADVSAIPLGGNPNSTAHVESDGSLIYRDAFGPGIDVVYRCEPLKTEEFIVIREPLFAAKAESVPSLSAAERRQNSSPRREPWVSGDRVVQAPAGAAENSHAEPNNSVAPPGLSKNNNASIPTADAVGYYSFAPSGADAAVPSPLEGEGRGERSERGVWGVRTFSWSLDTHGQKARLTPAHTIELCDDAGVPRLRINAPEGKDASGKLLRAGHELRITLDENRVTLAADTSGLDFPIVIDPTWSSTGAMAVARRLHSATLLNNGLLLVVGGTSFSQDRSTCEIYDPSLGSWSATGSLSATRVNHTATLLSNGEVLVVGSDSATSVCEIFNPTSGQWRITGALTTGRANHTATLLNNGNVLAAGGESSTAFLNSCELFDLGTEQWTGTGAMNNLRVSHTASILPNGNILATGGQNVFGGVSILASSEEYNPGTGIWTTSGSLANKRIGHAAATLPDGSILVAGGYDGSYLNTSEIFNPSSGTWSATGTLRQPRETFKLVDLGAGKILAAGGADLITTPQCEVYDSSSGAWPYAFGMPTPRRDHTANSLGNGKAVVTGGEDASSNALSTCDIFDPLIPTVSATANPTIQATNVAISYFANATDMEGHSMAFHWDFGDGTTSEEQNPHHSYSVPGHFVATVTATGVNGNSDSTTLSVEIDLPPVPRLQTSDVVAFASSVFTFDASTSTDPDNSIVGYDWDFGDGSPHGSGQVISKIYDQPGTYTVTLTITKSSGVSATLTRIIEVLSASEAGLFGGFMSYKVSWDRNKDNKDSISFAAGVNVGDAVVGKDTPVAFEIVGQRFTGILDLKQRDYTNPNVKWQLKANIRHQPSGTVSVKLKIKNADLGLGFNLLGVTKGADPHDIVSKNIPVHLEIGSRSFELLVPSDFKFNSDGTRARGDGESD